MGAREVLTTIRDWMSGLRRAVMTNRLQAGALAALAGFILVSLMILSLEAIGHFAGGTRGVLLALWSIAGIAALGLGIVWPLLQYTVFAPDDKKLAGDYAARLPHVKDRVLNALQLLDKAETASQEGYSSDMILEAGRSVAEELKPINPASLQDTSRIKMFSKFALGAAAIAVVLFAVAGRSLLAAGERVLNPGEEFAAPAAFTLSLKPGEVELVRGDSLVVEIYGTGTLPAEVILERLESGKNASEPVVLKTTNDKQQTTNSVTLRYVYRGITSPFTYWAHAGSVETEKYKVNVQELPSVKFLSLRLQPPAYTGLTEQVLEENIGDIAAVVGTQVRLQLSATKSLKSAKLEFFAADVAAAREPLSDSGHPGTGASADEKRTGASADSTLANRGEKTEGTAGRAATSSLALTIEGSRASGEFTVKESGHYTIRLTDNEGRENRDPIYYRISARADESPLIAIVEPAEDLDISSNVKVAVRAVAADDYGFSRMNLRYYRTSAFDSPDAQQDEANFQSTALDWNLVEAGKAEADYLWDLTPLDLLPEDQVMFFVEVWDNDRISGPKRAKSEMRTLRYPSMAEMFEQQEQVAEKETITLEELLKQSEELREKVEEAVQEFKSNPDMSWERRQEIEQLMQKQKSMNEMLQQVSEAIEKHAEQMEQRAMFSPEVMAKVEKIQELLREVMTPELQEQLRKMAEQMKQPTEEEMRKAMENMQKNQRDMEQALDQTLNMLEQLKMEKKMDELTRRLDELGRQQDQLSEKLEQNTDPQKNAEDQKKNAEEMKKIEQELKKLAQDMKDKQMKAAEKMEQMEKKSEEEQLSEEMKKNSEEMKTGMQNSSCKKKSKSHRRKMSEMANELQNIKNEMNQDEDQEALEKLERSRDQLLDLSQRQERLWKEAENLEAGSPQQAQAAEEQENLRQALSRVGEDIKQLSKESMHATPKLMSAISEANAQMQQACDAAGQRDSRTASHYRKQALAAINGALKENQSSCSSCKSQCNKPNPNSQCNNAGQMAGKQNKMNQQTREMMQGQNNPGSLSMGEQASMQRLAGEQRELAKSAEQLSEEAKASQQSVGKLDDLAKEMEEVAKDLENRNVTERTLEKQEQIENRLLDFQRANREREFSPKRQATTGRDILRSSPRDLPEKPGKDQLHEDLLHALDAKYTPDYENLIRAYFDALSKWK